MPFDLEPAVTRLRSLHPDRLALRRALLDLAFTSGAAVSEQAMALESGDAVLLTVASGDDPQLDWLVVDMDPPGGGVWPDTLDSLGGPAAAVTWAVALQVLLAQRHGPAWSLRYVRGPALGLAEVLRERLTGSGCVQLVPCPTVAGSSSPLTGMALTLTRAENVWRLPACDAMWAVTVAGEGALERVQSWLLGLPGAWTLHALHMPTGRPLTAILRTERAVVAPLGIVLEPLQDPPRLGFPVNDGVLGLPPLPWRQTLAARALTDGLWLAGLAPVEPADTDLPERAGELQLDWLVADVAREAAGQVAVGVTAAEAAGPVPAGLSGPIWRLPAADELAVTVRALTARAAKSPLA